MRATRQLPSFTNVSPGSTATLDCPAGGPTYDRILLEYSNGTYTPPAGGTARAWMKNIAVIINGKTCQIFKDGDRLKAINDYYGRAENAGFLTLWFTRPDLTDRDGQNRVCALGTADVSTLQISIDIDAGVVAPVLKASAQWAEPDQLGLFTKIKEFVYSASALGQFEIDNIPRGPQMLAMHLWNANLNDMEVELDSRKVYDASKALSEALQKEHGRVPQTAKGLHLDWCMDKDIKQALVTSGVRDFRLRPNIITATGAVPITVEYLDTFEGI